MTFFSAVHWFVRVRERWLAQTAPQSARSIRLVTAISLLFLAVIIITDKPNKLCSSKNRVHTRISGFSYRFNHTRIIRYLPDNSRRVLPRLWYFQRHLFDEYYPLVCRVQRLFPLLFQASNHRCR